MKLFTGPLFEEAGGDASNGGGGTLLGGAAQTQAAINTTTQQSNPQAQDEAGAAAPFDFRSALDEKGAFKEKWTDGLPAHLKDSAGILGKYPTLEAAMNGLVSAQRMIGKNQSALKAPAPDAPQAEKDKYQAAVREALSIPAKVEDYKITMPTLPEGVKVDDAQMKEFTALAHSLNITPAAAQRLMEFDAKRMAAINQQGQAHLDSFVKEQGTILQNEWGEKMPENLGVAKRTAELLGLDVNDAQLGNNAAFVKAMFAASKLIQPDKLIGTDSSSVVGGGTQAADDIRNNKSNPWHNAYHGKEGPARQQEALAVMKRLNNVK